jgi:cell division protein FtsW
VGEHGDPIGGPECGGQPLELHDCDRALLVSVVCLLLFGILMVYSSTSVITPDSRSALKAGREASQFLFLRKHLLYLLIGAVFMFIAYGLSPGRLHGSTYLLLAVAFAATALVFIPGIGMSINGARRWVRFWPSTIQPSEFAKLAMVVYLARYLSSPNFNPDSFVSFLKPLMVMGMFQFLFLKQPDFGAAMTLTLITFTMLFLSGVRKRYMLYTSALLIPLIVKLVMVPYRLKRILAFMNPWSDQQGSGYQLVQSLIALGSGGLTGKGIGESKQKLDFLPYINTDFIFSLMGEELGLIGVSIALTLFVVVFIKGLKIASRAPGTFHYYLGMGITYSIVYQMIINVAVVTGLAPTKGLPLPFISYGGSSLLVNMTSLGILLNLSKGFQPLFTGPGGDNLIRRKKARISVYGRGIVTGKMT